MTKVVVIILNYKVKDLAVACAKTVLESELQPFKIIVVDNNSQDEIEKNLPKSDQIEFIQTGQNLGYTGGNNVGIKKALSYEPDYVWVLNPDLTVEKDTLKTLVECAKNQNAGIVGPKIYLEDRKTIWYAGGLFDKANVLGFHRGVDEQDRGQYDETMETDYVTGAAMLISEAVLTKVGLFDEKYFLYYEDSDLSFRARQAGFKVFYCPGAHVFHKNAQSTKLGSPLQDYFITRNRMLFAKKFLSLRTQFALFREALRNLNQPIRRQAFKDYLLNNFGKGSFL